MRSGICSNLSLNLPSERAADLELWQSELNARLTIELFVMWIGSKKVDPHSTKIDCGSWEWWRFTMILSPTLHCPSAGRFNSSALSTSLCPGLTIML